MPRNRLSTDNFLIKLSRAASNTSNQIALICCVLLCFSGCQTPQIANKELPVPPAVLTTDQLDNVRFQSPDSDSNSGDRSRVFSRNSNLLDTQRTSKSSNSSQTESTSDRSQVVAEVIVTGNKSLPTHHLMRNIRTRPGRFFDPDKLQQDVDQLWRMPEISRINGPYLKHTTDGVIVTLDVEERASISSVEFIGNRGLSDRILQKETGLEDGAPLDVHEIRMAKTKIEDLYKEKGFPKTQVEIMEGNESNDGKVVFLIHEDEKQRIWKVEFEGNSIASDARLRHFIKSKPGIMKLIGGLAKRNELEQDITRLTAYYRSLGFFNARIGREVSESNDGRWMTIRFIINEGPRYKIRNVAFIGNSSYSADQLKSLLELKPNSDATQPEFNVAKMNQDVVSLRDLYGGEGFVFAKVEAEPRFLEEPGLLDLVYKIDEGKQYRVGNINVHYEGDYGITKREVVLNRLSLRPGGLIDVREIRNSERRLQAAQVFAVQGTPGAQPPRIVVRPPELQSLERHAQTQNNSYQR
ncbi:MAG: POTRA domain-containing protein [Mariniblastus sp.]|nr:POTRA domain-containing protein [Mariniblastus sp.]